jgi:hypothetical protein
MLTLVENYFEDYLFGLKLKILILGQRLLHQTLGDKTPYFNLPVFCTDFFMKRKKGISLAEGAYIGNEKSIYERAHEIMTCKSGYFSLPNVTEAMQPCSLLPQFHVRDPWLLPWQWKVSSSGTVPVYVVELTCSVSEAKHGNY